MRPQQLRTCLAWVVVLMILWGASAPSVHAAESGFRTWSDSKGKSKIKAKFLSLENGVVTLEKEDGTEVEIELKKLGAADQQAARDAAKGDDDNPFKSKESDSFKPKGKAKAKKSKSGAEKPVDESENDEATEIKVNLSAAEQITLATTSEPWKVEIPATEDVAEFKPKTAPLPPKTNFFEGIKGIAVNLTAKKAAVGFAVGEPKPAGTTRLVICDLSTGKSSKPAAGPGQLAPLALHDDGKQVVMRRDEFGFGNQDRLEVWTLKGARAARKVSWNPYDEVQGAPRDVLWAEFLDAETLATSSRAGKVVLWKFPEIEPICTFGLTDGAVPGLSPDRKLIAYCNGSEVGLFDVTKREVIAQQSVSEKMQWPYMAFSPSGKRLACIAFDKILVWETATGKLLRNIPAAGLNIHGAIDFADDGFVLAGGKYLIDLENQLKLWTYEGQEKVCSVGGTTFFATTDGEQKAGALIAARIPHAAATDLLKKALTDPSLFVLRAGTNVKVNVSGIRDVSQRAHVLDAMTKRLQAIGCSAGPAGSIELLAIVDGPKERTVSFFSSGDYKMQEYIAKIQFIYEGQPAWEASSTNVPGVVSLKKGENIGSVLKEREKPDYGFFDRVELPRFLQKPAGGQGPNRSLTLGQSRVGSGGIK